MEPQFGWSGSGEGPDSCVFRFRVGADSRLIPAIRIPGEEIRDSMVLVTQAAEVLNTVYDGRRVKMLFIDGTGIGGPIVDRLKQLGHTLEAAHEAGVIHRDLTPANIKVREVSPDHTRAS